ncbi:MAG: hypothetical protein JSU96_12700, partial [Acidobacteriota bacterium]
LDRGLRVLANPDREQQGWMKVVTQNDPTKRTRAAEEYLEEFSEGIHAPMAHALLSIAYAEAQNPGPATRHGEAALAMLPTMMPPLEYDPASWPMLRDGLLVDAYYGAGTAYLFRAFGGESQHVSKAMAYLTRATEMSPRDERSHLRLGFAHEVLMKNLEEALLEYARAAAANGPNSLKARQHLEQVYQRLYGSNKGMEKLISDQKKILGG